MANRNNFLSQMLQMFLTQACKREHCFILIYITLSKPSMRKLISLDSCRYNTQTFYGIPVVCRVVAVRIKILQYRMVG